jgi:Zn-dependent peptidase ImmA (M78 family)/transcriptional regulator with XRE-family HTH domain
MSPATSIGIRIQRARKATGLSLRALADALGVSHTLIDKYEAGTITPNSQQIIGLSKRLGVKVEYFLRPATLTALSVGYRQKSRQSAKDQHRVEAGVLDIAERRFELERLFPAPPTAAYALPKGLPATVNDMAGVEALAEQVRHAWNLGQDPIGSMVDVLESHGIRVFPTSGCEKKFDGLMMKLNAGDAGKWPIILLDDQWPGDRQRFTLAHELGHLLLEGRLASTLKEESACNRFAGAFLLPTGVLRQNLGERRTHLEPRELYLLKRAYGASMACVAYRAKDVGIINDAYMTAIMRDWHQRGWDKREPGEPFPSEPPRFFEHLVYRALAEDYIGESKAAELLGMSVHDFHARRRLDDAPDNSASSGTLHARPHQ